MRMNLLLTKELLTGGKGVSIWVSILLFVFSRSIFLFFASWQQKEPYIHRTLHITFWITVNKNFQIWKWCHKSRIYIFVHKTFWRFAPERGAIQCFNWAVWCKVTGIPWKHMRWSQKLGWVAQTLQSSGCKKAKDVQRSETFWMEWKWWRKVLRKINIRSRVEALQCLG